MVTPAMKGISVCVCVCMCTICECRDMKFYKRGVEGWRRKENGREIIFFFLCELFQNRFSFHNGVGKDQPGLKSRGQTGLAFVSAPVVCENTAASFCRKSLQRQKRSSEIWMLVVSSEVKVYLFARRWPCWVQWISSSWRSVYTCRDIFL